MSWSEPRAFALLWVLPLLLALYAWAGRRRRHALARLLAEGVWDRQLPAGLDALRRWQAGLFLAGLGLLVVALAGPRMGYRWRELQQEGVDLVVLLDLSRSMDARDVSPSRLERARRELLDLLDLVPGDRVGLVVFAAGAYPRVPLTLDHGALRLVLGELSTGSIRAQGTGIAEAIRLGLQSLDQLVPAGRGLVLVSDGETDQPQEALAAAEEAGKQGVPIFVLGVGTLQGAPIPLEGGGFKKDRRGNVVVSHLDEDLLRGVAARSGGAYVRSVASRADVEALVKQEIASRLQAGKLGSRREKVWNERFQWPLGAGLAMLLLSAGLAPRRATAALLLAGLLLPAAARAGSAREEGLHALEHGDYEEAVEELGRAVVDEPDDLELLFRFGEALYRAGRYQEAEQAWERVARESEDPELRRLALYDLGNAAYQLGRLTEAQQRYQQALQLREEWEPARKNAEAVARELAARMNPDRQGQEPDREGQGQEQGQRGQSGQEPGQQGQEGQGREGQEGQEGQQGQEQGQGQDQEGQDQGQGQQGQDQGQGQGPQRGAGERGQDARPAQEGERGPGEEEAPGLQGDELQGEIALAPGQEGEAQGAQEGAAIAAGQEGMSPEQALRLLDGVEEGSPRLVYGGRGKREQDW